MAADIKTSFLDDTSDSGDDFQINENYAGNYDKWRQKEELQKLKDKYGDKSDFSSSSSESEEEEIPIIEKDFLKTLSLLKSKDPKIYDQKSTFFDDTMKEKTIAPKVKKPKPMFMKDYERKLILEKNGEISDEEEVPANIQLTYSEEQEEIRESFKAALEDSGDDDDTALLQVRQKDNTEKGKEDAEYILWLKGEKDNLCNEDTEKDLKFLHNFWNDPKLDQKETFLKDYILNKKYLNKDENIIPTYDEITNEVGTLSDDEEIIEKQEMFEHKFNFRFEEPDSEFITQYPRTIGDSLRRKDNKRKLKREDYQERKKQEKAQKKEEIKRLKVLKRKEIEDKISKLKEITGNEKLGFEEIDIEGDFDPDKHDQRMKDLFNDDFYGVEETDKPQFPSDEELELENWDDWTGGDDNHNYNENCYSGPHCDDPDFVMDADYDPRQEFQKEMIESSKNIKKKKKSKFATAVSKNKPIFDPSSKSFEEYYDEYYKLDYEDIIGDLPVRFKYRKVLPNDFGLSVSEILTAKDKELNRWCSLKKTCQYRPEQEEIYDVQAFQKKSQNINAKQKILLSLFEDSDKQSAENVSGGPSEGSKKRKRKPKKKASASKVSNEENNISTDNNSSISKHSSKKMKLETDFIESKDFAEKEPKEKFISEKNCTSPSKSLEQSKTSTASVAQNETNSMPHTEEGKSESPKKKRKKKKKSKNSNNSVNSGANFSKKQNLSTTKKKFELPKIDDERLKSYGLNPKKLRRK